MNEGQLHEASTPESGFRGVVNSLKPHTKKKEKHIMATTGNRTIAAKKAFEKDPKFRRLKKLFPANTNLKKAVTQKGKK
ncbi:MAG: hypothetical protein M3R15_06630 [Acidobacteriota bacterium]|nr:hypothetical protein [Acidobacteriota bacterium]